MRSKTVKIFTLISLLFTSSLFAQSIIINELSNGPSGGSKEYVEFVVTGTVSCDTPPDSIDLRHWIFDDNNGYFASGSGTGIAQGVCRFTDNVFWSKIPVGTIILIYNDADVNADIPADDINLNDGNCRLVIPISSNLFERHDNQPNSGNSNYPTSGWVSGGNWTVVSMSNSNDSYQIRDINNLSNPAHSVSYGNNTSGTIIYFAGSGGNIAYYFDNTNNDDPFAQNNWIAGDASNNNNNNGTYENGNNDQTPGFPNSVNNETWITSLNHGCSLPPTVDAGADQTICGGSTTITATGGTGSAVYTWDNGLGTGASQTVSPTTDTQYIVTMTDNGWCVSDTVEIFVSNNISFTLSSSNPTACGATNGSITISGLEASTSYQITYNDGSTQGPTAMTSNASGDIVISNLGAGNYTDFVVDLNGCSATDNSIITLTEPNAPTVDAGTNQEVCEGQSVTLTASNPDNANITWDNGVTDGVAFTPSVGTITYTVTATLNGCSSTDVVDVTVNANPTPTITGNTSFCTGLSTTISANSGYVGYVWTPNNETTESITVNTAGNYTVNVIDGNNCTGSAQVTITENQNPTPSISGSLSFCAGSSTTLDAGNYAGFNWNTTETSQTIDVTNAGNYAVTVTDNNGCIGTDDVDVSLAAGLTPTITGNLNICYGTTTTLDAGTGFANYTWSPNSETSQTIDVSSSGTYSVTVSDASGCTGSDQVTVSVGADLTPTISGVLSICSGSPTTLDAGTGYNSYQWSTNETTQNITVTIGGVYSVTVSDGACSGETQVTVTENQNPTPTITGNLTICDGASTVLDAGNYASYNWSTSETSQTINVTTAGNFSVTVISTAGCEGSDNVNVNVLPIPIVSISGDLNICGGTSTTLDAGSGHANYEWNTNSTTQTINVTETGTYSVTVSDDNGCSATDAVTVNVSYLTLTSSGNQTICDGNSTTLAAAISGGGIPPFNYSWNTGETTSSIIVNPITETEYTVFVTDAEGCISDTENITVTIIPKVEMEIYANTTIVCPGDPVLITSTVTSGQPPYTITNETGSVVNVTDIVYPFQTETCTYTVVDACGSTANDMVEINTYDVPQLNIQADVLHGCEPLAVQFLVPNSDENSTYQWNYTNGNNSDIANGSNTFHIFEHYGTYDVGVSVVTTDGCKNSLVINNLIDVYQKPDARFITNPQTVSIINPNINFTNLSQNSDYYIWSFGDGDSSNYASPYHTYSEIDSYTISLVAVTNYGCKDSAMQTIEVVEEPTLYVPTAFSPDGDEINDLFVIQANGIDLDSYNLRIYDRWGELIFESNDLYYSWDGTAKGNKTLVEIGSYIWLVTVKDINGLETQKSGTVTIIR